MARQLTTLSMAPPINGATIGATPITSISSESTRAASRCSNRSRTMARATTWPAHPPRAWANRATASRPIDGARAQATDAAT